MSRTTALLITIIALSVSTATAGTFNQTPYLAEAQVEVLTKQIANDQFGRDLFGDPYATVVVGNVDVYDRFPYLEARYFQVVSDPTWNRLLVGEVGKTPAAYDGSESGFGSLSAPRGLSSDERGRIYVADTGNNRVLVFHTTSEFDRMTLTPLFSIDELAKPYDVAYSDGGTAFDASDDVLYVANTGRNEVRRYDLSGNDATLTHAIGDLGSGNNRFAGPMAITVGHRVGVHSEDVFVSDAHNGRLVRLVDNGSSFEWAGSVTHQMGLITSLDTDHWGNVYAAAPQVGKIAKYTETLSQIASFGDDIKRPRSFHVPFANVTDHRSGERSRAGQGSGIVVEEWDGENGIRLLNLGVELNDAAVVKGDGNAVSVTLTDHAHVVAEIIDPRSGQMIARHDAGVLNSGSQTIRFSGDDYVAGWSEGEYRVKVLAGSTYDESKSSEVTMTIVMQTSGGPSLPDRLELLGNTPNPFNPTTTIRFTVPAGPSRDYSLRIYDVAGRLVRELASGQIASGLKQVSWDGRSDGGGSVGSGIYIYRLEVGQERLTGKMVLVK